MAQSSVEHFFAALVYTMSPAVVLGAIIAALYWWLRRFGWVFISLYIILCATWSLGYAFNPPVVVSWTGWADAAAWTSLILPPICAMTVAVVLWLLRLRRRHVPGFCVLPPAPTPAIEVPPDRPGS